MADGLEQKQDCRLRCPGCRKVLAEELDGTLRIQCARCKLRIIFDTNGKTVLI
jgi:LSD1 subclass zinc finger protein